MTVALQRGQYLENLIEACNEQYKYLKLARIDKIPTPTSIDTRKGTGYFKKKSTVDFIGFTKNGGVAFDAKETTSKRLDFKNIHQHQISYLYEVGKEYGVEAFFIVFFSKEQEMYKASVVEIKKAIHHYKNVIGRKSIPLEWFRLNATRITKGRNVSYDYLELEKKTRGFKK